jgi:hypothetical protein
MRAAFLLLLLFVAGCASPVDGLWPPRPDEPAHRIVVSMDSWHSVIGLVRADGTLEERGYADKAYYLEGDDGVCGTLGALFVPGTGVIQTTRGARSWAERTPQPPARSWTFDLSEEGRARLVAHMDADVAGATPCSLRGGAVWHDAKSSYWMFHHCHHWTASALREAGLPVFASYAMFKWSLEAQLDRAAGIAAEPTVTPE